MIAPRRPPVGQMSVRQAFETKTPTEQLYAHHLARQVARVCTRDLVLLMLAFLGLHGTEHESYYARSPPNQRLFSI